MQQSIIAVLQLLVYALVYCLPMHYLHFIPFISFTCILYWVRAECRLTMSSPALNFTNSVIFLIEFGWFVFTTCMLSLKLPWPIMPNFTHISSSGIAPPCYMSTLSVTWGNSQNGPVFQAVNIGHPLYRGGWLATPPILCRMGVGQIGSLAGPPPPMSNTPTPDMVGEGKPCGRVVSHGMPGVMSHGRVVVSISTVMLFVHLSVDPINSMVLLCACVYLPSVTK